jgi:hypothetical protein
MSWGRGGHLSIHSRVGTHTTVCEPRTTSSPVREHLARHGNLETLEDDVAAGSATRSCKGSLFNDGKASRSTAASSVECSGDRDFPPAGDQR